MKKKNLMYDDKDSTNRLWRHPSCIIITFISIATLFSTTYLISGNTSLRMGTRCKSFGTW